MFRSSTGCTDDFIKDGFDFKLKKNALSVIYNFGFRREDCCLFGLSKLIENGLESVQISARFL